MRKISIVLVLASLFSTQTVLADDQEMSSSPQNKACIKIAKACLKGGYTSHETANKKIWQDCMKPIILGQSVKGVTVDAATVTTCRNDKIDSMTKELTELQAAASKE